MNKTTKKLASELNKMCDLSIYIFELSENLKNGGYFNENLYMELNNQKFKIQDKIAGAGNIRQLAKLDLICKISIDIVKNNKRELEEQKTSLINEIINISINKKTA